MNRQLGKIILLAAIVTLVACKKVCNKCNCELNTAPVTFLAEDFDDIVINEEKWAIQGVDGALTIVPRPDSTGNMLKVMLGPGDGATEKDTQKVQERAEFRINVSNPYGDADLPGQEVFYRWEIMMDSNYTWYDHPDGWSFEIMGQFHHQYGKDSPPFAIEYTEKNGSPEAFIVWREKPNKADFFHELQPFPFEKGVWHEVILHFNWRTTAAGFFEVWVDGESVTKDSGFDVDGKVYGRNLYNCDGNYLKFGYYRGKNIPTTNTIYYDGIRKGNSLEEVTP